MRVVCKARAELCPKGVPVTMIWTRCTFREQVCGACEATIPATGDTGEGVG